MNNKQANTVVQNNIKSGSYFERGHPLRYSHYKTYNNKIKQEVRGGEIQGWEALALFSYDMSKGLYRGSKSLYKKFMNAKTKNNRNNSKGNTTTNNSNETKIQL
jgi:hypothetical protein